MFDELKRRNVLKVGVAYLLAAWLLIQVAATLAPQLQLPDWVPRLVTLLLLIGFPIALLMAWFLERAPEGIRVEASPVGNKRMIAAAVVIGALALGWYLRMPAQPSPGPATATGNTDVTKTAEPPAEPVAQAGTLAEKTPPPSPKSIAVLPFVNMSTDKEQEFLADGLSEEILNSLTRIEGMQVVGRTSSFRFKGKNEDLRSIGQQLGVANVLEGSVRRGNDRARITAQLIRVSDGIHLWSQTYDRPLDDTLAMQLDIAENVADALGVVLDEAQLDLMRRTGVKNANAFIAFQKGRQVFGEAHDPMKSDNIIESLRAANVYMDRATALEPGLALAYQLGADLHFHIIMSDSATMAEREESVAAADRALDLAARHAHDEQQRLFVELDRQLLSDDWDGLSDRFKAVLASPGCGQSNWMMVGSALGYAREMLAFVPQIMSCDPFSGFAQIRGAESANWAGLHEESLEYVNSQSTTGGRASTVALQGVRALAALGRLDEARAMLGTMEGTGSLIAMGQLIVAVAAKEDLGELRVRQQKMDRGGWNPELWQVTDQFADVVTGDRDAANRRAAAIDAAPGGPLRLAVTATLCYCGAPFDLESTPNFKARLAESGLKWPPADTKPASLVLKSLP